MKTNLRAARRLPAALLALACASLCGAQQANPAHTQQLRAALDKTRKTESMAFKSTESRDVAMFRDSGMPQEDTTVSGNWRYGLLQATVGEDGDEVLFGNSRMLAKRNDGDWQLRRNCLANGSPLPFVVDPSAVVAALHDLTDAQLQVAKQEPGRHRDRDVLVYSVTLTGKVADQLLLSGFAPTGGGSPMAIFAVGGAGRMEMPRPEVTLDIAIYVDPGTNLIQRIHSKAYTKQDMAFGGRVMVRVAGPGGVAVESGEEEEEDEGEDDANDKSGKQPLEYQKGLPKRKLNKSTSLSEFDLTLSSHNEVKPAELGSNVKRLLDLR